MSELAQLLWLGTDLSEADAEYWAEELIGCDYHEAIAIIQESQPLSLWSDYA